MRDAFIVADNIISALGITTEENFSRLIKGNSGVQEQFIPAIADGSFYASLLNEHNYLPAEKPARYTKFEQLLIASVSKALNDSPVSLKEKKTILIISSTKGNISLIEDNAPTPQLIQRVALHTSARLVGEYFNCANQPLVVSNACISGLLSILTGKRLIQTGQYDYAVIVGADIITKFILSGFQSFQAISAQRCRPFDAARNGINLGEGAATMVLSADKKISTGMKVAGGAVSNDANHISGPSRTGEELYYSIKNALKDAAVRGEDIDFISAHGTATIYNDEMEALAISLAGLQQVPVNSLKGYYGHTLGAAGLIESVIAVQSVKQNTILPCLGYSTTGVSKPINVVNELQTTGLNTCLKTASGFGGCNAALIFTKA